MGEKAKRSHDPLRQHVWVEKYLELEGELGRLKKSAPHYKSVGRREQERGRGYARACTQTLGIEVGELMESIRGRCALGNKSWISQQKKTEEGGTPEPKQTPILE